jgi:glycosyltransferase involved in cell wall biosynthesis
MSKIKYVDLTLVSLEKLNDVDEILYQQRHSLFYLENLDPTIEKKVIKYCGTEKSFEKDNISYEFIKGKTDKWSLHLKLFFILKKYQPDAILINSFFYSFQIILLCLILGRKAKIMILNHAELPTKFPQILIQRIAAKFIDILFIVSYEQAKIWIEKKVFSSNDKIREMMEGSTHFSFQDKFKSKKALGIKRECVFLWGGGLNNNKDPLTILNAFAKYTKLFPDSVLYMIYNSEELIEEVKANIKANSLENQIVLLGKLPYDDLEKYYRAADYYVLGSSREGSGFSLCEAMACGCIPIVTNIPSFKKMTNNGDCGFLFSPKNGHELYQIFINLHQFDKQNLIKKVLAKFKDDLSFKAIATTIEREIKSPRR